MNSRPTLIILGSLILIGWSAALWPEAPRRAADYRFDGVRIGDVFTKAAGRERPYDALCDDDPVDRRARRMLAYTALPCNARAFPQLTSAVFYIRYAAGSRPYEQPVEAIAFLNGDYFSDKSDFPLEPGMPLARSRELLGKAERSFVIRYDRDHLEVHKHSGDIYTLALGDQIVGFVFGTMPDNPRNEQWMVLAQVYSRYTPHKQAPRANPNRRERDPNGLDDAPRRETRRTQTQPQPRILGET